MKRYLVGGAIRDELLALPVVERDWVVVGATPERMLAAGFRPVGKDFPVFLHPQTGEEHALARTERKSGPGYHGFVFHAGPEVTIEDDLSRRDLTVNAIARDDDTGELIDPYGGVADLRARLLRHVAPAFAEDPVRVLRVARFAARFAPLGFAVAPQTLALMGAIVTAGEVDHLVPERVWKETERALSGDGRAPAGYRPSVFFRTLRACGALARIMPELDALFGVPQPVQYHPEIDAGDHVMRCIDVAQDLGFALPVRVAALLHDLGKAATPRQQWPSHKLHDRRGVPLVKGFCERLRVPRAYRELAVVVAREHLHVHRAGELRAGTLLALLQRLRAFQRGDFFEQALNACLCDARGRLGCEHCDYPPVPYLRQAAAVAAQVQARQVMGEGVSGAQVGSALRRARAQRLAAWSLARRGHAAGTE
ncbi:MAG: multifunctional CCA addition/repair protein [Gammaproteobacteria bacterium]|nr:multifunctional CCA addition/repair protein [Gammaproteobacteria bacterium]